jgi:hypothetical protein
MSMYRLAVQNGLLIRQKRRFLRFWQWAFNRSEEDHLIRMKNRLVALRQEQTMLLKMIPEWEDRIKKAKDQLNHTGGVGVPYRDTFSLRREPVRLNKDVNLPGNKKPEKKATEQKPLFTINQANK